MAPNFQRFFDTLKPYAERATARQRYHCTTSYSFTDNIWSPIPISDWLIFYCGNLILHQKKRNQNDKNTHFIMKHMAYYMPHFILWLPLLHEILGNMYIVIVCWPVRDVINFEISIFFLIKPFFLLEQKVETKI